jgi:hypothetical protein
MSDMYVLGSGPSLTFIDPDFFTGKTVIATNRVGERLGLYDMHCTVHTHSHYQWHDTYPLAEKYPQHQFWVPEGDQGHPGTPGRTDLPNVTHYPHQPTRYDFTVETAWPPDGGLIVGSTSLHGSMHLACVLGARNVILVGADCGMIDQQANQDGYFSGNLVNDDTMMWLGRWEQHLRAVKHALIEKYGVRIYSLNPFLNFNLEGHTWTGP